jgi:copper chaperone CopZ
MNKFSRLLTAVALALSLVGTAAPSFAATSVKVNVNGMVCAFCAQGIEKRLSKLPATKAVYVDLKQKLVIVEAKDGQTLDATTITTEITDAGYDVTKLETLEQSLAEIKVNMKGKR